MATFRQLVEGVEDNNKINKSEWANWSDLSHVEEVYGDLDDEDISRDDATAAFDKMIASNGRDVPAILRDIELAVMGQNFAGSWWNRKVEKVHNIEISIDNDEGEQFAEWLIAQGHTAKVGNSTGNYVDGVWTSTDNDASETMNALWAAYCQS